MDQKDRTLQYYNQNPDGYIALPVSVDLSAMRERFMAQLPEHAFRAKKKGDEKHGIRNREKRDRG